MAPSPPLGHQIHLALVQGGVQAATALAVAAGQPDLFERVNAVATEAPTPSFLHSALCAMSLPVRRPADEQAPIIRQDGQYTLVINPKPRVEPGSDGQQRLRSLGIPFGSLPRLILIHIMTEAVRTQCRQIVLGRTFTEWMRRLGFRTISYGPRGSATLIRDQLDRLLACEWMIRFDGQSAAGEHEFGIKEIKLTNEYIATDGRGGNFQREIVMTEGFFTHLRDHAVPLNENAIRQLRDSPTAIDLYTWLAYRLPRISDKRPSTLSWQQLAVHFGNDGRNIRKFRQTVRDAWDRQVSAVYPEARAQFDTTVVRLFRSPAPLQQKLISGARLGSVADGKGTICESREPVPPPDDTAALFMTTLKKLLPASDFNVWFRGAVLSEDVDHRWLNVKTSFLRDYINQHFDIPMSRAAEVAGLGRVRAEVREL